MPDVLRYGAAGGGEEGAHAPRGAAPAIVTHGLVRRFGAVAAVDGLDLEVANGEIYGFLGPNGAGKSTLLRILCTLLRPSAGRAVVAGHDVAVEPQAVRLRIGVALQEAALDDRQSGRELLALQGRLYGMRAAEIRARLADVLDLVDIGGAIDRRIGTYSGGMKRRIDLAAALMHNPGILFLDEPTTGLDPISRAQVWSEVRRLNAQLGTTIFLTTQYLEEADNLAGRVGILSHGRLVAEGPPATLKRAIGHDTIVVEADDVDGEALAALEQLPTVAEVRVEGGRILMASSDGAAALHVVALSLGSSGAAVRSIAVATPSLDDVFRTLTDSPLARSGAAT